MDEDRDKVRDVVSDSGEIADFASAVSDVRVEDEEDLDAIWLLGRPGVGVGVLIRTFDRSLDPAELSELLSAFVEEQGLLVSGEVTVEEAGPPDAGWLDTAVEALITSGVASLTAPALRTLASRLHAVIKRWRRGDPDWRNPAGYL